MNSTTRLVAGTRKLPGCATRCWQPRLRSTFPASFRRSKYWRPQTDYHRNFSLSSHYCYSSRCGRKRLTCNSRLFASCGARRTSSRKFPTTSAGSSNGVAIDHAS